MRRSYPQPEHRDAKYHRSRSRFRRTCSTIPTTAATNTKLHIIPPMTVKVNGEARELPDGETLRQLVARHQLTPEKVALELNRRLVRSDRYDQPLKDGDEVEIVTFVGGG